VCSVSSLLLPYHHLTSIGMPHFINKATASRFHCDAQLRASGLYCYASRVLSPLRNTHDIVILYGHYVTLLLSSTKPDVQATATGNITKIW